MNTEEREFVTPTIEDVMRAADVIAAYEYQQKTRVVVKNAHLLERERKALPRMEAWGYVKEKKDAFAAAIEFVQTHQCSLVLVKEELFPEEAGCIIIATPKGIARLTGDVLQIRQVAKSPENGT